MDGYYDWVKEHIQEVGLLLRSVCFLLSLFLVSLQQHRLFFTEKHTTKHKQGAPLNEADHCGDPPLLLAAGNGHLPCCKLLLEEGADVDQRNVMGESPLIRAAHNGHFHTVRFLLDHGADINAVDLGDNTALHWAAMRGHVEIVKFLLKMGADKALRNKQEKLPIDLCEPNWSPAYRFTREILA